MIPIVSIVGKSNSGKTNLMVALITELKRRGYRVAAIKHSNANVQTDIVKKDTWRYSEAGSEVSAITTDKLFALFKNGEKAVSPEDLYQFTGWEYDVVLAEGFKRSRYPQIEVHRREFGPDLVGVPSQLIGVVTDEPLPVTVPQFAKEDTAGIADMIEKIIVAYPRLEVEVMADGKSLQIDDTIKDVLSRTVAAMFTAECGDLAGTVRISVRRRP